MRQCSRLAAFALAVLLGLGGGLAVANATARTAEAAVDNESPEAVSYNLGGASEGVGWPSKKCEIVKNMLKNVSGFLLVQESLHASGHFAQLKDVLSGKDASCKLDPALRASDYVAYEPPVGAHQVPMGGPAVRVTRGAFIFYNSRYYQPVRDSKGVAVGEQNTLGTLLGSGDKLKYYRNFKPGAYEKYYSLGAFERKSTKNRMLVVSIHLPHKGAVTNDQLRRDQQTAQLDTLLKRMWTYKGMPKGLPILLGGDFNQYKNDSRSKIFSKLESTHKMKDSRPAAEKTPTFEYSSTLKKQIDFIYHRGQYAGDGKYLSAYVKKFYTNPSRASDHRLIWADHHMARK